MMARVGHRSVIVIVVAPAIAAPLPDVARHLLVTEGSTPSTMPSDSRRVLRRVVEIPHGPIGVRRFVSPGVLPSVCCPARRTPTRPRWGARPTDPSHRATPQLSQSQNVVASAKSTTHHRLRGVVESSVGERARGLQPRSPARSAGSPRSSPGSARASSPRSASPCEQDPPSPTQPPGRNLSDPRRSWTRPSRSFLGAPTGTPSL
jgi:hypothetical protein